MNEELGAVIQVANKDIKFIQEYLVKELGLSLTIIGAPTIDHKISILNDSSLIYSSTRGKLQQVGLKLVLESIY